MQLLAYFKSLSYTAIFTKPCCELAEPVEVGTAAEADEPRCNLFALQYQTNQNVTHVRYVIQNTSSNWFGDRKK